MKTIAQQLNVKDFPLIIKDKNGKEIYHEDSEGWWCRREYNKKSNEIYHETSTGYWCKREYDKNGNEKYYENSAGLIIDNRSTCDGKIVEIEGKKYKLKEI